LIRASSAAAPAVEEFQRLVGAERQHPADLDAVGGQRFLQPALVLQHQADRIVIGIVEPEFVDLVGGKGASHATEQSQGHNGCAGAAPQIGKRHRFLQKQGFLQK